MTKNKKPPHLRFKACKETKTHITIQLFFKLCLIGIVCFLSVKSGYVYADTFKKVGKITGINYRILISIAYVESGLNPLAINVDGTPHFYKNKVNAVRAIKKYVKEYNSVDIGLMQINYELWGRYLNLTIRKLLEPKINILAGAFILKYYIKKYGYSWETIGRYHSSNAGANYNYRKRIKYVYELIKNNK